MDELGFIYIKANDRESNEAMSKASDAFEAKVNECISKAESIVKENLSNEGWLDCDRISQGQRLKKFATGV